MFRLPFVFLPPKFVEGFSNPFMNMATAMVVRQRKFSVYFAQAEIPMKSERYVAVSIASQIFNFIILSLLFVFLLIAGDVAWYYGIIVAAILVIFMFIQQISYPQLLVRKKVRNIEMNLLPALRAMTVQLTAGVTFYNALKNIARGSYGVISEEFQKSISAMESGTPAIEALERISRDNPSIFFRRAIWQIVTGMQVGADISGVLKEIVKSLIQEQVTEIQSYGGKLSPMSMFYMVVAIIFPALSVTFILILSTFLQVLGESYKFILFGVLGLVVLLQIVFLGMIKSGRPPLV